MALSFTLSPTRLLNSGEKLTRALFNQILSGLTGSISGKVASSDMTTAAVIATNTVPGPYWFGTGTYAAGVYSISLNAAYTAYATGDEICFQASGANAAGAVNVNVNSLGSKDLLKENGRELEIGDIPDGWIVTARYNGTAFQVVSVSAKPTLIRGGTFTNGATVNDFQMALTPSTLTLPLLVGLEIEGIVLAAITGRVNIVITPTGSSALASKPLVKNGNVALASGDLPAGAYIRFVWDGTNYQLLTPVTPVQTAQPTIRSHSRNLRIAYASANTVTLTADEIVLTTSAGTAFSVARTVSLTLDNSTTGANGRDTGTETADAWYYIWIVSDGTNVRGVLSLVNQFTALSVHGDQLPDVTGTGLGAGYIYFAQIGAIRNTGGNFVQMMQMNGRVVVPPADTAYATAAWGAVDVSTYIPIGARLIRGSAGSTSGSARIRIGNSNDGTGTNILGTTDIVCAAATATNGVTGSGGFEVICNGIAGSSFLAYSDSANGRITVSGYEW